MILYYAVGGGLGHIVRGHRVLEALGLAGDAAIVTASTYARDARIAHGVEMIEVPQRLEKNVDEHRSWLRQLIHTRDATRLIADAFPGGIQGELCGLPIAMDAVARLLDWEEYRRAVEGELPRFGTTWTVEELTPAHDAFVRGHSARVIPLQLSARMGDSSPDGRYWVVVHSGPQQEVAELVAYAAELRVLTGGPPMRILVATRSACDLPDGFERVDCHPAEHLFPLAERIISGAGFNVMLETERWRDKHEVVPFARRFDEQYLRAARRRLETATEDGGRGPHDKVE